MHFFLLNSDCVHTHYAHSAPERQWNRGTGTGFARISPHRSSICDGIRCIPVLSYAASGRRSTSLSFHSRSISSRVHGSRLRNVLSTAGDPFLLFRTDDLYSLLSPFPSAVCPLLFGAVSASAFIDLYAAEDANDSGFAKKRFSALAAIPLRMYVSTAVNQITRAEAAET